MKKIISIFLTLFFTVAIYADTKIDKIAIINIQQVIETVFADKSSFVQGISNEKAKMQENLNKIKDAWMKLEQDKVNETDEAKKISYDRKIEELKKQYADYYRSAGYQIEQKIKSIQEPLFKEIYDVVKKISESQGYSLVLDSKADGIFYYSAENDITEKVISYFKNENQ